MPYIIPGTDEINNALEITLSRVASIPKFNRFAEHYAAANPTPLITTAIVDSSVLVPFGSSTAATLNKRTEHLSSAILVDFDKFYNKTPAVTAQPVVHGTRGSIVRHPDGELRYNDRATVISHEPIHVAQNFDEIYGIYQNDDDAEDEAVRLEAPVREFFLGIVQSEPSILDLKSPLQVNSRLLEILKRNREDLSHDLGELTDLTDLEGIDLENAFNIADEIATLERQIPLLESRVQALSEQEQQQGEQDGSNG